MKLSDLPARELARLDAICLDYEMRLRDSLQGRSGTAGTSGDLEAANWRGDSELHIDSIVASYGGQHSELLRTELEAIQKEIQSATRSGEPPQPQNRLPTPIFGSDTANAQDEGVTPEVSDETSAITRDDSSGDLPPGASDDSLPAVGTSIGPYTLTGVLGRGGMGVVYRATDTRLDRSVAIKMLSVRGQRGSSLVERFQREAKAVAGLTHPHIVELFDVGVYEGMPYAVMEHLRGETLLRRMQSSRTRVDPITTQQVRRWGLQLADALATAHAGGVIHRDLKPENVMVVDRTRVSKPTESTDEPVSQSSVDVESNLKLFDFGLSRVGAFNQQTLSGDDGDHSDWNGSAAEVEAAGLSTRVGMILGTPGYMAPEQARGDLISPATDVFALGCVLFEAMYGRPAFAGDTATKRFAAVLEKPPLPDPARRRDDVVLADLILSMLAKDPAKRPTASQVLRTLQTRTLGETVSTPREHGGSSSGSARKSDDLVISRRRLVEIVGGAVAGGVLATTWFMNSGGQLQAIRSIGVLSFQPAGASPDVAGGGNRRAAHPQPAGGRDLDTGELLSGLLVNELSRLKGITVPKYVPMTATQPAEFREAARLLEVDALVTGTYSVATRFSEGASAPIMTVNLDIVSGHTGKLIEGIVVSTTAGENLIEQAALAQNLAELIGQQLIENDEKTKLNHPEAFTCLIKGRTYTDPDTTLGLERALKCFQHATQVDSNYAQAHAGIALTAITLAAREDDDRARELIGMAQDAVAKSLALAPENQDALLARAMLDYQILFDFNTADVLFERLTQQNPNHWQVQHQSGWLKLIRFEEAVGMQLLRRANGLHPTSRYLQVDLARAEWFRGNPDRAIPVAEAMLRGDRAAPSDDGFARGLLIDVYEQMGDLENAARVDPKLDWQPGDTRSDYYTARQRRLVPLPYGPFGNTLNQSILHLRRTDLETREPTDQLLSRLIAAQLPMLPMLISKHPAFATMSLLPQAVENFSVLRIG